MQRTRFQEAEGARLEGGISKKTARGELRRGVPIGFVWVEQDGEVRFQYPARSGVPSTRRLCACWNGVLLSTLRQWSHDHQRKTRSHDGFAAPFL